MNLPNENSSKDLLIKSRKILFFFLFAAFASVAQVRAQTINDDLETPKPSATPRPKTGRQPVKPKQTPVKKPVARPAYNPPPAAPPPRPAAPPVPAAPVQTPTEIIERFMDFQQSQSVTGKDWDSVVKQTTAILQISPDDKTARGQLALAQAELAFNRNDYSNALIQFNAAAMTLSDSPLPFYGIGRVYLNTKQPNQAEDAFGRALKKSKNFALGYKGLGDAATAQGKTKKADDYYKQAARATSKASDSGNKQNSQNSQSNPANANAAAAQPESTVERDLKIARDYTSSKKWQMSLDKLQPLAASNPSAEVFLAIGDNYFGMEAWLSAQQAYRKATEMNPNSALAFFRSGMVLYQTNEFQAAGEAFEKSLILDQSGTTINRAQARKWADKANEKARDMIDDK